MLGESLKIQKKNFGGSFVTQWEGKQKSVKYGE